jgi:hypothetical protein
MLSFTMAKDRRRQVDVLSERTIEEIREEIHVLESLDLRDQEPDELLRRVRSICRGYMWMTRMIKKEAFAFRARRISIPPGLVSEMWYPPANLITRIGRANGVGEPMFYVSSNGVTAVSELRPVPGETFYVMELELRTPSRGLHMHEVALAESSERRSIEESIQVFHQTDRGRTHLESAENVAKLDAIRQFMVNQFTRVVRAGQEHEYGITLAIAKFHRTPGIDGLMYPSVARNLTGTNAVFTASVADRLYRASNFWMVEVDEVDADSIPSFRVMREARALGPNGRIFW